MTNSEFSKPLYIRFLIDLLRDDTPEWKSEHTTHLHECKTLPHTIDHRLTMILVVFIKNSRTSAIVGEINRDEVTWNSFQVVIFSL